MLMQFVSRFGHDRSAHIFPSLVSETLTSKKSVLVKECELVKFMVG